MGDWSPVPLLVDAAKIMFITLLKKLHGSITGWHVENPFHHELAEGDRFVLVFELREYVIRVHRNKLNELMGHLERPDVQQVSKRSLPYDSPFFR